MLHRRSGMRQSDVIIDRETEMGYSKKCCLKELWKIPPQKPEAESHGGDKDINISPLAAAPGLTP